MTHARTPAFFLEFGVPDTVMGRFDVLSMHIYLLARKLRDEGTEASQGLSQEVFDLYVFDVERALRQLGIGDTSVPKKKKKMIRSFYGQIEDFDEALNTGNERLIKDKVSKRYLSEAETAGPDLLASYMSKTDSHLHSQDMKMILSGDVSWLSPESFTS